MKKYCKIICIVAMGFSSSLFAENMDATVSGVWSDTDIWTVPGGKIPTSTDAVRIRNNGTAVLLNSAGVAQNLSVGIFNTEASFLTIANGGSLTVSGAKINIGDRNNTVGVLAIDGGSLSAVDKIMVGGSTDARANATGTVNINSGSFSTTGNMMLGSGGAGSAGTLNMKGGTLDFNSLVLGNENATGTLNLDGGTTTIKATNDGGAVIDAGNGKINMSDGVLKWLGGNTHANMVESWVNDGLIDWSGTTDTMLYETWGFSATNATETSILYAYTDAADSSNSTFVWSAAVPEPATIGMVLLGSIALLVVRKQMFRY